MNLVLTIDRDMRKSWETPYKTGVETIRQKAAAPLSSILRRARFSRWRVIRRMIRTPVTSAASRANRNDIVSLAFEPGSIFQIGDGFGD